MEACSDNLRKLVSPIGDLNTVLSDVSHNTGTIAAAARGASTSATEIMKSISTATADVTKTLGTAVSSMKEMQKELASVKTQLSDFPMSVRILKKESDGTVISIQYRPSEKTDRIRQLVNGLVAFLVPIAFVALVVFVYLRIGQRDTFYRMKECGITVICDGGSEKHFKIDTSTERPVRIIQE